MNGISKVLSRIETIEQRFQIVPQTAKPSASFAGVLGAAQKRQAEAVVSGGATSSQSVKSMVDRAAKRHGVDSGLALAVAKTESGFQPDAVSDAGAIGVMQLMPQTAAGLGVDNPYDAEQNVDAGVRYLKQMLSTFQGDPEKAVAAYNAGPEAVRRYGGVPPYQETQSYVSKVLSLYRQSNE